MGIRVVAHDELAAHGPVSRVPPYPCRSMIAEHPAWASVGVPPWRRVAAGCAPPASPNSIRPQRVY
jgi:hypothetical protein